MKERLYSSRKIYSWELKESQEAAWLCAASPGLHQETIHTQDMVFLPCPACESRQGIDGHLAVYCFSSISYMQEDQPNFDPCGLTAQIRHRATWFQTIPVLSSREKKTTTLTLKSPNPERASIHRPHFREKYENSQCTFACFCVILFLHPLSRITSCPSLVHLQGPQALFSAHPRAAWTFREQGSARLSPPCWVPLGEQAGWNSH